MGTLRQCPDCGYTTWNNRAGMKRHRAAKHPRHPDADAVRRAERLGNETALTGESRRPEQKA